MSGYIHKEIRFFLDRYPARRFGGLWVCRMQVFLHAKRVYGIILADNDSNRYGCGVPDPRFENDMLHLLDMVIGNDFKTVDTYILTINPDSGQA